MKKSLLVLISLLFVSNLQANSTLEEAQLKANMREMLRSMEMIQKGGFYAKPAMMKKGVVNLKEAMKLLDNNHAKRYLPKEEKYAEKFAAKRAKMIIMYAEDIPISLDEENMDDALEDYSQILRQCSSCHLRIRKW